MSNNILRLTSPICPSVNHYLSYRVVKKGNKNMAMSYKTQEAKRYQKQFIDYIKDEVLLQKWTMDETGMRHIYVDTVFYFPRLDLDANNYFKVLLDAITDSGVVWKDDNIVCERVERILYDSENPRIELKIHYADYIGIFNDEDELFYFENKCKSCTRYKRNCSILKKAKEGRIQKEINEFLICTKYKENKDVIK